MSKRNELLDKNIEERINKARYEKGDRKESKPPVLYMLLVFLVTLSVFFSILRYLNAIF